MLQRQRNVQSSTETGELLKNEIEQSSTYKKKPFIMNSVENILNISTQMHYV